MHSLLFRKTTRTTGIWLMPVALIVVVAGSADGAAAPAALYGKSIIVSWGEGSLQRNVGEPNWRSVSRGVTMSIYISTAGHVFSRQTNNTRAGTGSTEQVAGQGGKRVPVFSGHEMTMFGPVHGGVRRVSVSFDAGFTSCTATAGFAKEVGRSSFNAVSPIDGRALEIMSVSPGPATCSIRNGNVFAGE